MTQTEPKKQIDAEIAKYEQFIKKITEAFNSKCDELYGKSKKSHDRATLAEDAEHATQIIAEFKVELGKIKAQLKQTLETNDKRFLKHIEKVFSRIEQAQSMQEIENQLKEIK
ncbi:hypothetical protein KKG71_02795 [Patescibacteria group bacterium]|nr:hypothetical protein [Patescibacteria group bacterium]